MFLKNGFQQNESQLHDKMYSGRIFTFKEKANYLLHHPQIHGLLLFFQH